MNINNKIIKNSNSQFGKVVKKTLPFSTEEIKEIKVGDKGRR